ncbi:hypothetical protein ACFUVV_15560 [Streptomyces sp. NPDC057376]|nr:hypothetical protein [Streptomyces sp. CB02414]
MTVIPRMTESGTTPPSRPRPLSEPIERARALAPGPVARRRAGAAQ